MNIVRRSDYLSDTIVVFLKKYANAGRMVKKSMLYTEKLFSTAPLNPINKMISELICVSADQTFSVFKYSCNLFKNRKPRTARGVKAAAPPHNIAYKGRLLIFCPTNNRSLCPQQWLQNNQTNSCCLKTDRCLCFWGKLNLA